LTIYNAAKAHFPFLKDLPDEPPAHDRRRPHRPRNGDARLHPHRNLPTQLAPSQVTTLAINSYLWRAAVDTVSFAPLLQANAQSGVIITDWYTNPKAPGERVKLTVAVLDPDLRTDALRVSAAKQVYQNGAWVDSPVSAATVQKLEDIILTRARDLRRGAVRG